jgi:hypothetical protein
METYLSAINAGFEEFRHSRMFLAGIQEPKLTPIKTFGGDELGNRIPSLLSSIFAGEPEKRVSFRNSNSSNFVSFGTFVVN